VSGRFVAVDCSDANTFRRDDYFTVLADNRQDLWTLADAHRPSAVVDESAAVRGANTK